MTATSLTITATFEDGVLHPDRPLPLAARQRVTLIVQVPQPDDEWPDNVAEIYQEVAAEDRRLAAAMFPTVRETWPTSEGQS